MIPALERFDKVTAAGILARAALAIEGNPAGDYRLPYEQEIRDALVREAMHIHGIDPADRRPEALARLGDVLDTELDLLIVPQDREETLKRLSTRGDLPSELFEIDIIPDIAQFHGSRYEAERKLIHETVRTPHKEQHYGPHPSAPGEPFLVSLFLKYFPDKYPGRSFAMLVGGQRHGLALIVHHAWRIYIADVDLAGANTLVDVLERFSEKFGVEMKVGDKKGRFILSMDTAGQPTLAIELVTDVSELDKSGKRHVTMTAFQQNNPQTKHNQRALVTAIDLVKYKRILKAHRGY